MSRMTLGTQQRVAVIGAGTMGSGIAFVAAAAGHPTVLIDGHAPALQRSRQTIADLLAGQVRRGQIGAEAAEQLRQRLSWSDDLGLASDASLTIEAIIEDETAKADLFERLEAALPDDAIIASNTSSLSIEQLARRLRRPARFVGLHFFNPVPAMKLVEVIGSGKNDPALLESLRTTLHAWGKEPVRVRDVPGFIVNRVARPYYAEGFRAVEDGIAAETVDSLLEGAGGFRMGPLALSDLIGQDVNYSVARAIYAAYHGKGRFRPSQVQAMLVETGALGRKSAQGFYAYAADGRSQRPASPGPPAGQAAQDLPLRASPAIASAALAGRLRTAGYSVPLDHGLDDDAMLALGEWRVGLGDGRTLSERTDLDALMDLQRDPATATALGVTARSDAIFAAIASLFARAGVHAIQIPDRPGQIVLRTLAQLANAAFDALADQVADSDGIDAAMRLGANHPEGPLRWAENFGRDRLALCLTHLAHATGDEMYLPSPALGPAFPGVRHD